ncbi:MAG TPA: TPM domain-containing protein [Candidatus Rubrimentiphilum sp.]|nr:TPM domain-containing protein [Candidatus Rubrimentiphilum sp.]
MIAAVVLAAALTAPPRPTEYVTDNAGALSSSTVQKLDTELNHYEDVTGHRVIVWIGQTTGDVPLENWTVNASQTWKIGRKGKDDGAVLFLFMQDRKIRIEVGYGLEGSLTDADSSRIINETIRPAMRAGNPDAAVQAGVDRMLLTITPSFKDQIGHPVATPATSSDETRSIVGSLIIFLFIFGLLIFLARVRAGKRPRGSSGLWFLGTGIGSGSSGGGGFGGGLGGGGFGGGFGGGGASGGW